MFRFRPATGSRAILRIPGSSSTATTIAARRPICKRFVNTESQSNPNPNSKSSPPPNPPTSPKHRSWRNTVVRLGLAIGVVYYYNTSSSFAKTPSCMLLRILFLCHIANMIFLSVLFTNLTD